MFEWAQAEFAVVGSMLIDERCVPVVRSILSSGDSFSNENCAKAYDAIRHLSDRGKPVDPVTVGRTAELGNDFLRECMETAPSCSAAAEYATAVLDGFRRRQLREVGERMQTDALSVSVQTDQLLTEVRSTLDKLASADRTAVRESGDSLRSFIAYREAVQSGRKQTIRSGFPGIDGVLGGFAGGGLYIVAARPGVGKSAFGIALGDMLAKNHRVLYASLEMSDEELTARRVSAIGDLSPGYNRLLFSSLSPDEEAGYLGACGALAERKFYTLACSKLTVAELGVHARNCGAEVVVVDYLGLLSGSNPRMAEYDRVTEISGDLKRLAKQLGCVIIALCQLNRESTSATTTDKQPQLSQLRSSGSLEQDADGVLLLHRPEYGNPNPNRKPHEPQEFIVNIAKNRHGRTGSVRLGWYAPVNRFTDGNGRTEVASWR